jgi:dCMP deaminase
MDPDFINVPELFLRPTRDQMLMVCARAFSERSTCARSHVGVVVAHEGRIIASGYNGTPAGMRHCDHNCTCPGRDPYGHYTDCEVNNTSGCKEAVHAEANAIADAARYGRATNGGELFTTMSPCYPCSQLIINAGIVRVVYLVQYRITDGLTLLKQAGVEVNAA